MHTLHPRVIAMRFLGISLCFYNWSSSKGFHLLANVSSVLITPDEDAFLSA